VEGTKIPSRFLLVEVNFPVFAIGIAEKFFSLKNIFQTARDAESNFVRLEIVTRIGHGNLKKV